MATSQNGYTANDLIRTQSWTIPGTTRKIRLRKGSPGALLVHLAAWFDKNIESVDGGQLDDWGYAERPIRGSTTTLSNHASGTAMDLNAPRHPLGARNTFTDAQEKKIRAQLKVYEGCIRWGGDYKNRADEMHFEIDRDVATCDRVLAKLNKPTPAKPTPINPPAQEGELTMADIKAITDRLDRMEKNQAQFFDITGKRWAQDINEQRGGDQRDAQRAEADRLRDVEQDKAIAELKTLVQSIVDDPDSAVTAADINS